MYYEAALEVEHYLGDGILGDSVASSDYRRRMVIVTVRLAFTIAAERAGLA
jgi:hypothetical protein